MPVGGKSAGFSEEEEAEGEEGEGCRFGVGYHEFEGLQGAGVGVICVVDAQFPGPEAVGIVECREEGASFRSKGAREGGKGVLYRERGLIVENGGGVVSSPKIAIINIVAVQIHRCAGRILQEYLKVEDAGVGDGEAHVQIVDDMVVWDVDDSIGHPALGSAGPGGDGKGEITAVDEGVGNPAEGSANGCGRKHEASERASCTHRKCLPVTNNGA